VIYGAENCRLHKHAKAYRQSYGLEDIDDLKAQIDKILDENSERSRRFVAILHQLVNCRDNEQLRKADLAEEFDVDKKTIQRDMHWFVKNRLVKKNIQTGYAPEPRLNKLVGRLEKINPERYKFETVEVDT